MDSCHCSRCMMMNIFISKAATSLHEYMAVIHKGRFKIKMFSYQYRDSHLKDKTVSRPSYLYNANPHTWKDCFCIDTGPKSTLKHEDVHKVSSCSSFVNKWVCCVGLSTVDVIENRQHKQMETETTWPPFYKQYFKMHFPQKFLLFCLNFTKVYP